MGKEINQRWANDGPKGSELAEVEAGINRTMSDIIRHDRHRPSGPSSILGSHPERPRQAQAVVKEITQPAGLAVIDRMLGATEEEMERLHPTPKAE